MRIGVISDTHGDLAAWQKALAGPFAGVELILHAGDLLYQGPRNPMTPGYNPAALADAINSAPAPVVIARGNCDSAVDQLVLNYPIQAPYAFLQLDGVRLLVNHGDSLSQEEMVQQARSYRAQFFIFGHIHTPVLEDHAGVILLNPGSAALPKSPMATVGLIDTAARSVAILDLTSSAIVQQLQF